MKKILSLSLVALFSLTGYSFAATTTVEKETKKAANNTKTYVKKKTNDINVANKKAGKKIESSIKKTVNNVKK